MLNTASSTATSPTTSPIARAPQTLPASPDNGARQTSRALWMGSRWQSAPAGFVDYSATMSAISPRLRTTRRLAVDSQSPLQRSLRESFEALGLLGGHQQLDEARITELFVNGNDHQALRGLAVLAEAGILKLTLPLNQTALRRQFFAGDAGQNALPKNTTLAGLLALKGRDPQSSSGGMSLADRFTLLSKSGFDIHGPQYPGSKNGQSQSGCCSGGAAASQNTTLMHMAASAGNLDALKAQAEAGLYIDATDHLQYTPLMRAAEVGHAQAARILLERGAKTEIAGGSNGVRATHLAVLANSGETLRALADHQANLLACSDNGRTALHLAAGLSNLEALSTLIALGCDLEHLDEGRPPHTPLGMAAKQGKTEAIAELARAGALLDTPIVVGRTALHLAALNNKPESIATLHQHGASLDLQDDNGATALHLAACFNTAHAGEALIYAGCNLNLKNNRGLRPVDEAGLRSHYDIYRRLVSAGAEGPHHYEIKGAMQGGI